MIENVTTLPQGTDTQVFCYDDLARLTWAGSSGTPTCSGAPTPGDTGSLTGTGGAQYSASYSYDSLNRLTSAPLGSYTYGDAAHVDAATAIGAAWSASYDAAGEMTCRAATSATTCAGASPTGAQLAYDNEGQLATWANAPGSSPTSSASYLYDGEGQRVEQVATSSGVTTTTRYIGRLEEVATTGTTTTTTAYYGGLALSVNGALSYTLADGLGSVSEAVSATTGAVTATQLYAPYGAVRYASGTLPGSHGFTGQHSDAATSGLDYYGARYYDPAAGQFTSADTTLAGGLNRYGYVGGNPTTLVDPTGHVVADPDTEVNGLPDVGPTNTGTPSINLGPLIAGIGATLAALGVWLHSLLPSTSSKQVVASVGDIPGLSLPTGVNNLGGWLAHDASTTATNSLGGWVSAGYGPTATVSNATPTGGGGGGGGNIGTGNGTSSFSDTDGETTPAPQPAADGAGARQGGGTPLDILRGYQNDPSIGSKRTVAFAIFRIGDTEGIFIAVSGTAIRTNFLALPAETLFTTFALQGEQNSRAYDAERIIFENIAARWAGNPEVTGTINMYVGHGIVCLSCAGVVNQFQRMFPNITIRVDLLVLSLVCFW